MKRSAYHVLRSSVILSLVLLLIPGLVLFLPAGAHAFGGLAENGTAAFMGIGTVPQKILHVSGSGVGTVPLFVRGTDSAGFIIERTSTNRWVFGVNEDTALGNGFVLSTFPTGSGSSVPRLLVTPNGNVAIGTTSPDLDYKLHVQNDNTTSGTAAIYAKSSSANTKAVAASTIDGYGVYGTSNGGTAIFGSTNTGDAVYGWSSGSGTAVTGISTGTGIAGWFTGSVNITDNLSVSDNLTVGTASHEPLTRLTAVNDTAVNGSKAVYGEVTHTGDAQAVYGLHSDSGNYGFLGDNTYAVYGYNDSGNRAALGSNNYAGYFWGNVKVDGSFATAYHAVSANYTIAAGDSFIAATANPGSIYVTLPSASGTEGRTCTVKKVDTNPSSHVYVYASGSESIDITNSYDLSLPMKYVTVVSNGSDRWYITANN